MRTDRIDTRTNFSAVYKLPYTKENMTLVNDIITRYKQFTGENAFAFKGGSPLACKLDEFVETIANQNGASAEWLRANSKRYNVEIPDTNFITVISSDNDTKEFDTIYEMAKKHYGFVGLVKHNLFCLKTAFLQKIPEHIYQIILTNNFFEKEQGIVAKFMYSKKVKEISTPEKLLIDMLEEKKHS